MLPDNLHHPILVTGAHRTGTTWVGKMLTASGEAAYISEPLNVLHRPGVMRATVTRWYTYICAENEDHYLPALRETLAYRYHPWREIRALRSLKDVFRMGRDGSTFWRARQAQKRPLLKDPFAIFSASWFARRLNCQVVVTLRHPAAFASSLKRLNWPFEFRDLLDQPFLMRDWLADYQVEMENAPANDIIARSCLLWRIIYQVVQTYREKYPNFYIVRHEDLSLNPVTEYRRIYKHLALSYSTRAQQTILNSSRAGNPREVPEQAVYSVKLDSQANLQNWKQRLSPQEINRVRQLTGEIAAPCYPADSWE